MVNIITDSTADLSSELIERFKIQVVPLWVHVAGQAFRDDASLTPPDLFAMVEEYGELPKTAAPSVVEFLRVFDTSEESVYIGISSRLSASILNAQAAAQSLGNGKVRVIDSLNLSTGLGLLVLKAAELRDQGCTAEEIASAITLMIPKIRMSFVIDTMKYLYMGGRCTALQSVVGGLLKIRPVIYARPDGTLGVKDKIRGSRKRALESLLKDFEENVSDMDLLRVFITHPNSDEDAAFLAKALQEIAPVDEVLLTHAGAVVSSHCGPGTIGLLYMLK